MRTIILGERQVSRVIDRIISEQKTLNSNQGEPLVLDIPRTFSSGDYTLNTTEDIDNALKSFNEYTKKFPENQKFSVTIISSESKVPNRGVGLNPGDLSRLRAEEVLNYIEPKLPDNITPQIQNLGAQGPRWVSSNGSNNQMYTRHQFVRLAIQAIGQSQSNDVPTKEYCTFKKSAEGGFNLPQNDYTKVIKDTLGSGSGNMTIFAEAFSVPDIIYFNYNGKTYGRAQFSGNSGDGYRIGIGTPLVYKYGSGKLPQQYGETTFMSLNPTNDFDRIVAGLEQIKNDGWDLFEGEGFFRHIFGNQSPYQNQNIASILSQYDTGKINARRLVKTLGNSIKWGMVTSPILPSVQTIGPIQKVEGVEEISIINVAPCGATKWTVNATCNQ
jgi:hypothetical protein